MTRQTTLAIAALAMLVALGACGRRGDLEPPPGVSPDMAATPTVGCPQTNADTSKPVDANPSGAESGNPNRMDQSELSPC